MKRFNFTSSGVYRQSGGEATSGVQGQSPSSRDRAANPLKLKHSFERSMKAANLPTFLIFGKAENHTYLYFVVKGAIAPCTPKYDTAP